MSSHAGGRSAALALISGGPEPIYIFLWGDVRRPGDLKGDLAWGYSVPMARLSKITGLSTVNRASKSRPLRPWGCSPAGWSWNRSTTLM